MDLKTPVSILLEQMVKHGYSLPVYDLKRTSGPSHSPVFEYVVRAGSITATGCAKTKQEAKHNAAQNALKQLNEKGALNTVSSGKESKTCIGSNGFENTTQSPVSILQEIMIKKGFSPVYDLIKVAGESHKPIFEYVVRVNNVTSFGQGRTKRDAKHNAAKNALIKLENLEGGELDENQVKFIKNETNVDKTDTSSKTLDNSCDGSTFTPVSILNSCFSQDGVLPEFKLTKSDGPQHNPTFEYTVKVKDIVVTGVGKTKKEAKQTAAKNALDKLKEKGFHPNSLDNTANSAYCNDSGISSYCEDETYCEETLPNLLDKLNISDNYENDVTDSDIIHKRNELKGLSDDINSVSIYEYHNVLKRLDPQIIKNAKNVLQNYDENDLKIKLRNVMQALKFTYNIEVLPCEEIEDFGFTIKILSNPIHVIPGIGKSKKEAEQNVILNAFTFFDIMLN